MAPQSESQLPPQLATARDWRSKMPIFEGRENAKNGEVHQTRAGSRRLGFSPYPGELGKKIFDNVSKEAWGQWLEHQKMLVNENRLSLADAKARKYLAEQMDKHFFGSGAEVAAGYVPPASK